LYENIEYETADDKAEMKGEICFPINKVAESTTFFFIL
jgi:hypothetical protein